jgi:cyanophycinase
MPSIVPVRKAARRGEVIAIGGAEDKTDSLRILRRVVELAGGSDAHIVIVPTASRLPVSGHRYAEVFMALGAGEASVTSFAKRRDCSDRAQLDVLERATGIFITGGNQLRLTSIIGGTDVARTIRRKNAEGVVVAGTSAGAAVLSEHMIAYGQEGSTPRAGMVAVVAGLGLINQVVVDQHFRQRDRLGRLLTAIAYNPFVIGVGLDEDTAVSVDPNNVLHVTGSNAVTIVDPSAVSHIATGFVAHGDPVAIHDLRLHVLVDGATFDLNTREAREMQEGADSVPPERLAEMDRQVRGEAGDETNLDPSPLALAGISPSEIDDETEDEQ